MKEAYFTKENIKEKANEMLADLEKFRRRHKLDFSYDGVALLVLDMQDYFLLSRSHAYIPSSDAIIDNINNLIKLFKSHNKPVILTKHIDSDRGIMLDWWRGKIDGNNLLSNISDKVISDGCDIIDKSRYDAFMDTDLNNILQKHGITQIVIVGVMTHLCCETTARVAFMNDYSVLFTIDGTATQNEQFHKASLLNLSHGFATPVLCDEIIDLIGEGK